MHGGSRSRVVVGTGSLSPEKYLRHQYSSGPLDVSNREALFAGQVTDATEILPT